MSTTKDILVDALRVRYDAYSAETVFELACNRAGLEGKTTFEVRELAAFRGALEKVGDRVGGVLARIDDLLGGTAVVTTHDAKADSGDSKPTKADAKVESSEKADAKPTAADDSKSNKADDSRPNKADDSKSNKTEDSKPIKADDSKPIKADDSKPTKADDSKPIKADDSKANKADDSKPTKADAKV
jgi:hypothetical protein